MQFSYRKDYEEIIYEKGNHIAQITMNRPQVVNAWGPKFSPEFYEAICDATADNSIGVIVLTGAGKNFSSGLDMRVAQGMIASSSSMQRDNFVAIRDCFKPTIAAVRGWCVGGANVMAAECDLTIASETARFMQVGPRVGSFNALGCGYMARLVGIKKAKEFWFLCRPYSAQEALEMGLVNKVVPDEALEEEVEAWCQEILKLSPTALKIIKGHFQADSEHYVGLWNLSADTLKLFEHSPEVAEGANAFLEKREPDFWKFYET